MVDLGCIDTLNKIQRKIGYFFSDTALLVEAFTHSSAADDRLQSNERLEFLGDSVLGVVICHDIFEKYSEYLEGDLTKVKSSLVARSSCAKITGRLNLQQFLRVGKGTNQAKSLPRSIEAGLLESVIGAIYIDGGLEAAKKFIIKAYKPLMENMEVKGHHGNYKSIMQQYSQEHYGVTPQYVLLDEKGPAHNKCFESEVMLEGYHYKSAWGVTKKEAEQKAAYNALVELGVIKKQTCSSSSV